VDASCKPNFSREVVWNLDTIFFLVVVWIFYKEEF
jgi:hypothetical protein